MVNARGQGRLLARHFFWRFLDNDLISPDSDVHEMAALGLAFLAVPSLLGTGLFLFTYATPFATPYQRLVTALSDKYLYIAWSMLVMSMVTLVEWDALSLDARDYAVLGALPIPPRALLAGKLLALAGFVIAVIVAVNAVPTILFPLISLSATGLTLPLSQAGRMVLGHAVSCVGAAVFGFLAILALRGLLLTVLGPRWFRHVALPAQFAVAVGLVIAFVSLPSSPAGGGAAVLLSPPMWFLGLYEIISGPTMFRAAGLFELQKWQVAREHRARDLYLSYQPMFSDLAMAAVAALAVAAAVAFALYFAAHFRHAAHLRQTDASQPAGAHRLRRRLAGLARRVLVRDPLAQATFFFTLQALGRSVRHKLYVAAYLAAGVLITYVTLAPVIVRRPAWLFTTPRLPTLWVQLVLSFFLLVGLRAVFAIPAELRANWLFRLTVVGDPRRYLAGVRRAVEACVVAPLFLVLLPLHAMLWGPRAALLHAVFGVLWALVLLDVLMLHLEKLPFTCSHVSGKGGIRAFWPVYPAGFIIYAYWFARREEQALAPGGSPVVLALVLLVVLIGLRLYRDRQFARRSGFVFSELPDTAAITLEL
jgi:hypothetical protein